MSTATVSKKNTRSYIHVIVMLLLMFGVSSLPPVGLITDLGMNVLGVFFGMLYGWIFIDLLWPSLFGFVALGLTGYTSITDAFAAGFGDTNFVVCLVCTIFANSISAIGVTDAIAYWLLSKKIFVGRPWLLISAIMGCSILMGLGNGGFATVFLLWSIVQSIANISGYERGSKLINMMMAFIVYGAMTSPNAVPFYALVLLYGGFFTKGTGLSIPAGPYFVLGLIYTILAMAGLVLLARYIFKIDASNFSTTPELCEKYKQKKSNKYQKVGLILLAVYFFIVLIPEVVTVLPGRDFLRSIGMLGFAVFYIAVFVVWKKEDGKPVLDLTIPFKNIPWAVMMLLAVTYPLSTAMESDEVGITATINHYLVPLLSNMNVSALIILSTVLLGLITQIMHNIVLGAIFIPIICTLVIDMGGNPYTAFFMIYMSLACAYVTPAGSMMAGLVFGHQDMVKKDAYIFGFAFLIVNFIVLIAMMPLCNLLF